MTIAVCLKCGETKMGALTRCPECNYDPMGREDSAKHIMASDQCLSRDDIDAAALSVKSGQPLQFDQKNVADLAAAFSTVQSQMESWRRMTRRCAR